MPRPPRNNEPPTNSSVDIGTAIIAPLIVAFIVAVGGWAVNKATSGGLIWLLNGVTENELKTTNDKLDKAQLDIKAIDEKLNQLILRLPDPIPVPDGGRIPVPGGGGGPKPENCIVGTWSCSNLKNDVCKDQNVTITSAPSGGWWAEMGGKVYDIGVVFGDRYQMTIAGKTTKGTKNKECKTIEWDDNFAWTKKPGN